ncbi:MAG TPA: 1-(5-phosphoribosyl)-5-[(5-phosphoribosylamino)methylideneamino]imidazole-4-carboxamide isomerase [Bacteroidales bacterium]|nr:1-(5-phosphoribosyl)-5-[(5-phosphoribosylamino)methylideneamino]imidazole-4-carboxamide isomerase [Bacteroidales bacterium]
MRIIPALDIIGGKCVRLTKGDFNTKKVYNDDPVAVAKEVEDNGLKYLHVVDLDGAKEKKIVNLSVLEKISSATNLKIDFGGGVRSTADLTAVFSAGASQVTGGSVAVVNKPLFLTWLRDFGQERIILGADSLGMKISTCGWTETSDKDIIAFITGYRQLGVKYVICTDISRDGMLGGPSADLYREILAAADVSLIASGGVSSMKDIEELQAAGCEGVIVGKAIYEGKLSLKELGCLC